MRKSILIIICILCISPCITARNYLFTLVKEATWKNNLDEAYITMRDSTGNVTDTLYTLAHRYPDIVTPISSRISIPFEAGDSVCIFEVSAPGYETQTICWDIPKVKKRQQVMEMPPILMKRMVTLGEVTVTASKVKFYNKGDTIVYNADAFQLAEGSMLDALISQLPGAKIEDGGRITVNGEFVETLLLNGKELFNNDHSVMLENIGAYTVKNIEVYKGHTFDEKWHRDLTPPKHLTMDVKLKKEYSYGLIVNAQGGYGTEDRYLGRLFASWFTSTTSVALTANLNNLNSTRSPGRSDSWTPENMPSGQSTFRTVSLTYDHRSTDGNLNLYGGVGFNSSILNTSTSTSRTNFLSTGNTFDRAFNDSRAKSLGIHLYQSTYFKLSKDLNASININGSYADNDQKTDALTGVFNKEHADMSRKALEAIYSSPEPGVLESVINRSNTRYDNSTRHYFINVSPFISYTLGTGDRLYFSIDGTYTSNKNRSWNDYDINFGSNANTAERRRQYTDNTPNHNFSINPTVGYSILLPAGMYLNFKYACKFDHNVKDSYMYALDRLEDMGVYGVVPDGYLNTLDPSNSYTSTTNINSHELTGSVQWLKPLEKTRIQIMAFPTIGLKHSHLDYWRDNRSYVVKRNDFILSYYSYNGTFALDFDKVKDKEDTYAQSFKYLLDISTQTPDLLHLVDVTNDADPLNIAVGNPDLHSAISQKHTLKWVSTPFGKPFNNILELSGEFIHNDLVRGYVYNTKTGVRHNRTYNVNGNHTYRILDFLNIEFGSRKQFTLASATDLSWTKNYDMIGVDLDEPQRTGVNNFTAGEDIILTYKFGRQSISLQGTASHRHTGSSREGFNTINAQHYKYGTTGTFSLPAGFGISTDFFIYKRAGYGVKELDTNDAVWNMRITYTPPRNSHWVFTADGFDLLHKLSNVHYAVTATGRTVTYTNTLPRYMLLTVQYKFNMQPKK
ncbi:MAG: hypothetical protein NC082_01600 [Clostridiales bacterium]|nr:hypothetical protein [Clostridiales bacterium]